MRSYSAQDIITLPTLNTASAIALGQELLTAAKTQTTLPQLISARASALENYGQALGVTLEGQDPNIVNLREPLLAFIKYLRSYVLAVSAHTDPDDPTSAALTDALLAPLHKWQTYVTVTAPDAPVPPVPTTGAPSTGVG